jgi:hypothetical protein
MGIETKIPLANPNANNLVINSAFDFWQRGTTNTSNASAYLADRFKQNASGLGNQTMSRSADVPNSNFDYSLNISCDNVGSPGQTGSYILEHIVEGNFAKELYNDFFVFSFYVKTNRIGTYGLSFTNTGNSTYISEINVTDANWNRYFVVVPHQDSVGTWLEDNGRGINIQLWLSGGSDYAGSGVNYWQEGQIGGSTGFTPNLDNFFDNTSNEFFTTGWMLHSGREMIDFKKASDNFQEELQLCYRYFETKSEWRFNGATAPSQQPREHVYFKEEKRVIPVVTFTATGEFNFVQSLGSEAVSTHGVDLQMQAADGNQNVVRAIISNFQADAEL